MNWLIRLLSDTNWGMRFSLFCFSTRKVLGALFDDASLEDIVKRSRTLSDVHFFDDESNKGLYIDKLFVNDIVEDPASTQSNFSKAVQSCPNLQQVWTIFRTFIQRVFVNDTEHLQTFVNAALAENQLENHIEYTSFCQAAGVPVDPEREIAERTRHLAATTTQLNQREQRIRQLEEREQALIREQEERTRQIAERERALAARATPGVFFDNNAARAREQNERNYTDPSPGY